MSFDKPDAPDPTVTSNAQMGYNQQAATAQNKTNSYDQSNPFSSINYIADASSPSGYRIQQTLNPEQQALLNTRTATQGQTGQLAQNLLGTAGTLAQNTSDMYSRAPDLGTEAIANQLNQWKQAYQQPIFDQQSSNLEAQLRNQGLSPGSEAYNNAKNLLARNQGDVTNDYLSKNQAQAYSQAVQNYQLPLQTQQALLGQAGSLFGASAPTAGTYQTPPQAQIQPANYSGQVQQNYQNQMQSYENDWNNAAKLGTAAIGLAGAPFTGGASLLGTAGSLFGGTPDYGQTTNVSYGGQSVPQFGRSGGW